MERLTSLQSLPASVAVPRFDRAAHGTGIVHIGLGAFFRAHQAVYTDDALAAAGGDWRIAAVNLRSTELPDALARQDCLYTLVEKGAEGDRARIIGALSHALTLTHARRAVMETLCARATRIVSITVTEKGYGVDRVSGGVDPAHPAIAADLSAPSEPVGLAGLLVEALRLRRQGGTPPFAVMSCDNLPNNSALVRALLTDFAARARPQMADFIAQEVAFPSTMVDRITPAPDGTTRALAEALTQRSDEAAVEAEVFSQWVIEDHFPLGRPEWEAGGAILTADASPFEAMKLRMLNGAHSLIAYAGFLAGHTYVRDAMADDLLAPLVRRHLEAAACSLTPPGGVDLKDYATGLADRFANPSIAHETYQIAMDGSQKMPQRIFAPAIDTHHAGGDPASFAFATAAWLRYLTGKTDNGEPYALRDPLEAVLSGPADAPTLFDRVATKTSLMPPALAQDPTWRDAVLSRLSTMLNHGMGAAIAAEARALPAQER